MMKYVLFWISVATITICCLSCEKERLETLPEDDLGACERCEFIYRSSVQLDGVIVVEGNNLVFTHRNYFGPENTNPSDWTDYSGLSFEVPVGTDAFHLDENDMGDGKVVHLTMCPACGTVALKPVNGFVKGEKVSSNTWLVEADVVLAAEYSGEIFGTLTFQRYFKPE